MALCQKYIPPSEWALIELFMNCFVIYGDRFLTMKRIQIYCFHDKRDTTDWDKAKGHEILQGLQQDVAYLLSLTSFPLPVGAAASEPEI